MWYIEAYNELSIPKKKVDNYSYGIYPMRFYKNINPNVNKEFDFIFIGGLFTDNATFVNRRWIIPFIKKKFNDNSFLQFTDKKTKRKHKKMGKYDRTYTNTGFVPKEIKISERNFFDKNYFDNLSKSKFGLCPAGDSMFSMRFYECLMCKCIPIINTKKETYRSKKESELNYKYYLSSDTEFIYREDWANHNYDIFLRYHTLEYFYTNIHIFGMKSSGLHLICDAIQQHYTCHTLYDNFEEEPLLNDEKECTLSEEKINGNNILLFKDKIHKINNDNKTISLLIIRDVCDVITSRIYKNDEQSKIDNVFIDTYKKILKEALNIDNNIKNKMIINTDKFIQDSAYANDLLHNLNIKNYTHDSKVRQIKGGDKTIHDEKIKNDIVVPSHIIDIIEKDAEFIDIIHKYYGYDIRKKIKS